MKTGDVVIDNRGRAWRVRNTETALRHRQLIRARNIPLPKRPGSPVSKKPNSAFQIVQPSRMFRVPKSSSTRQANAQRWKKLFHKYVLPLRRVAARRRRVAATLPLRPCPVCQNGEQPCRFKLGIAVWKGKRLRVCSTSCSRTVKKEVTRERRLHPEVDRERTRKIIAWRYMKRGGQA